MKKRLIAVLCILALIVGVLTIASAQEAEEETLKVGYAKVDINPYWSVLPEASRPEGVSADELMPLFLAGSSTRLATEKLIDDNGDGVIDGNDGLQATCIAISKGDKTVLLISADLYNCYGELIDGTDESDEGVDGGDQETDDSIDTGAEETTAPVETTAETTAETTETTAPEDIDTSKKGIRTRIAEELSIPANMVMVSATHTNGSVNMRPSGVFGVYEDDYVFSRTRTEANAAGATKEEYTKEQLQTYFDAYFTYLTTRVAEAAQLAVDDLETATIQKGSIDVSEALGGTVMNQVSHTKKTDAEGNVFVSTTYSNSNLEAVDEGTPVSEADDMLHLITFQFENAEKLPIVMANWRADASLNYSQATKAATSDYVNALRYSLEYTYNEETTSYEQTMRAAFSLGASANVNAVDIRTEEQKDKTNEAYAYAGVVYGQTLASAAQTLLTKTETDTSGAPMVTVAEETSNIYTSQLSKYRAPIQIPSDLEVAAAAAHDLAVAALAAHDVAAAAGELTYPWVYTDPDTQEQYEIASADEDMSYPWVYENTTTGEKYVIASSSHANSIQRRYGYKELWGENVSRKMELNAILIGNDLAFVTVPFEAADRYSMDATLENTTDNDWDDLVDNDVYGTPFVMSCTNDYIGHVPNYLSYNYNTGAEHEGIYAVGCYESQISPVKAGSGETTVAKLDAMLHSMTPIKVADCEYCGQEAVDWLPLTNVTIEGEENVLSTGHYYLKEDVTYTASQVTVGENQTVCLDLNGYTYSVAREKNASRAFMVKTGAALNIWDTSGAQTGKIMGRGVDRTTDAKMDFAGGTISIQPTAVVNLYSGTLTQELIDGYGVKNGGVLNVLGTFNMRGGTVTGGQALKKDAAAGGYGGNIYITKGTDAETAGVVNIYGGSITDGYSQNHGANVHISNGTLNVYGGSITNNNESLGTIHGRDVFITNGSTMYMNAADNTATVGYVYAVGNVTLSGAGTVDQLSFASVPAEKFVIDGTYTGTASLKFGGSVGFGTDVGNALNSADISGASFTVENNQYLTPAVDGDQLLLTGNGAAAVVHKDGTEDGYATVKEALDGFAAAENPSHIKLYIDYPTLELTPEAAEVTLEKDTYLDLNGCDIGTQDSTLNITDNGYTLYCMDSQTDDYTVEDGNYGKLLSVTGNIAGVPRGAVGYDEPVKGRTSGKTVQCAYLMVTDETDNNAVSFHRTYMELWSVTLHSEVPIENTGIYYESYFQGDEFVKDKVARYGVATTLTNMDTDEAWKTALETSIQEDLNNVEGARKLLYSDYQSEQPFAAGPANTETSYIGTCLNNIMSTEFGPMLNKSRSAMTVYGSAYIITTDGQVLFSQWKEAWSLQTTTEGLDAYYQGNISTKFPNIIDMYKNGGVTSVMNGWDIGYIKAAAKEEA